MEESWPSMWISVRGWFTPTVLFVLLNLVIGTIAVTSKSRSSHRRHPRDEAVHGAPPEDVPPLLRGPSAALERLRSVSLYRFRSGEIPFVDAPPPSSISEADRPAPLSRGPSAVLETLRSIGLYRFRSGEISHEAAPPSSSISEVDLPEAATGAPWSADGGAVYEDNHRNHHYGRSRSETGEEAAGRLAGRMKKSASDSSAFAHFEADEIARRPATARGGRHAAVEEEESDEEVAVDARADDFINRFRQQLNLQRLDSIVRFKEMLNRGT
ncbi:hypothetical protein Cni_G00038 [Canna indica]|uniref:DUF4408 domain-containing protein n=1 Tax=Canna indica TaxID=4628 RepID=A0AAQ3JKP7_9LILI|nr:hypothetical protein Cni_G00038 [Canna indica]